ncbi:MAG: SDR family NAD(P)-dependent oxidoreductase [Pseudomonadota bacterium]
MTQKSILITGCSSGIGYDAAHAMRRAGWRVFATCRAEQDCARLRGEGLESFVLDYTDEATMVSALATCLDRTGGTLDALYNNGAIATPGPLEDIPTGALREIFETNVFGYHALARLVIPVMRAQGFGRIVNCSSVLGFIAMRWRGPYIASKYALEGLTDTLRLEMSDTAIKVILIDPGAITSDLRKKSIVNFEKWVDWKTSARSAQYEATLLRELQKADAEKKPFELPASAVSEVLLRALTAPNPKARYLISTPTKIFAVLKRLLPDRWLDRIILRA